MTTEPTVAEMYELFKDGVLGTKEFRSWLALKDDSFGQIRDADVDNEIDAVARQRRAEHEEMVRRLESSPELTLVDKEGNIKTLE